MGTKLTWERVSSKAPDQHLYFQCRRCRCQEVFYRACRVQQERAKSVMSYERDDSKRSGVRELLKDIDLCVGIEGRKNKGYETEKTGHMWRWSDIQRVMITTGAPTAIHMCAQHNFRSCERYVKRSKWLCGRELPDITTRQAKGLLTFPVHTMQFTNSMRQAIAVWMCNK